jgi:hypothetical protein
VQGFSRRGERRFQEFLPNLLFISSPQIPWSALPRGARRILALLYVAGMAVHLILILRLYGKDYYLHGAIPVAFHWVLALFVLVWARLTYGR